jgi:prolipoprotein diacylglyceryl transferase
MSGLMHPLASIPSPPYGVVHLGPIPLRAYALMIILGVVVAVWLGERRWVTRGGSAGTVVDIAVWAVPFGLVGARLYHVITDHQRYFGAGQHPIDALKVWTGGLGIWGGVALGTLGAYIGCRRRGISLRVFADAAAPGIALAQAIGRWGNWFNQELYGRPLHTWWALSIDSDHRPLLADGTRDPRYADIATYHPTFLYESLWCVGVAVLVIWAERRFRLTYGRAFALYVAAYTVGRFWIESLRIDAAHHILGLRLNDWTSLIVLLAAAGYLYAYRDRGEAPASAYGAAEGGGLAPAIEAGEDALSEPEPVEETAEAESPGDPAADTAADDTAADETEADETEADETEADETEAEDVEAEHTEAESSGTGGAAPEDAETGDAAVAEDAAAVAEDSGTEGEAPQDAEDSGTEDAEAGDTAAAEEAGGEADEDAEPSDERAPEANGARADDETATDEQSETAASGEPTSPRSG